MDADRDWLGMIFIAGGNTDAMHLGIHADSSSRPG
jgi:hypothetical protein